MAEAQVSESSILQDYPRLSSEDRISFRCGRDLACFGHCCRDVSIVLTPYDVLRMKRALGLDSSEFLERHTLLPVSREQRIPVVLLKMDGPEKACPFVGEAGCGVYAARPWACRMYPLGVAEPRTPTPDDRPFHFLIRDQTCLGHSAGGPITVRAWREQQGIDRYDAAATSFKDLMLHDWWDKGEPLPPGKLEMFYTACYDLDRFRRFVFDTSFLAAFEVDPDRATVMAEDDEELLEFAMQWLRFCLFGDRTMRLRPGAEARGPRVHDGAQAPGAEHHARP